MQPTAGLYFWRKELGVQWQRHWITFVTSKKCEREKYPVREERKWQKYNLKERVIPPTWRLVTKGTRCTTSFSADKSRHVRNGATDWRSLCCQGRVQTVVWKEPSRLNGWEKGISWYKWKRVWITQGIGLSGMKWMHLEWQNSQHHNNNYAITIGGNIV